MEDLPLGFRFYPTEEELVCFYLKHKLQGRRLDIDAVIPVINIYHHNPWNLPQLAGELSRGAPEQCFFFVRLQENRARGEKPNRPTAEGYWKDTGSPSLLYSSSNNQIIGGKRTMVFYKGRAPSGRKTEWKMNEYKAVLGEPPSSSTISDVQLRHEFSLCRIYKKNAKCDRGFDRRPSAPAMAAQPRKTNESSSSHQQIGTSISTMAKPSAISQFRDEQHHTPYEQNVECDNFWDVCVPLWDWENMGFCSTSCFE